MAAFSYWLISPLALAGKIRGWDRAVATPVRDWRNAKVDVIVPARNEEASIALALESTDVSKYFKLNHLTARRDDRRAVFEFCHRALVVRLIKRTIFAPESRL